MAERPMITCAVCGQGGQLYTHGPPALCRKHWYEKQAQDFDAMCAALAVRGVTVSRCGTSITLKFSNGATLSATGWSRQSADALDVAYDDPENGISVVLDFG